MDTKILNRKINHVRGYHLYLKLGIFILILAIALIAMEIAGVLSGSEDEDIFRIGTPAITIFSVLVIGWTYFLMSKKKNYANLLNVDGEEFARIVEDTNNLGLNTATFALGDKYAYFYGELIKTPRKLICIKYQEIACAEFITSRSNEEIHFYNNNNERIATVGGYKNKRSIIKSILLSKGVSIR